MLSNRGVGKEAGWKYLLLSIGALLGIALEYLHAFGWEPLVYGGISFGEYAAWQAVLHWTITCVTWVGVACLLFMLQISS